MVMHKRGQFYIISALIIVAIIISFATISNTITGPKETRVYDIGEELGIEGDYVITHGKVQQKDIDTLLSEFSEIYSEYVGNDELDLYFVYGGGEVEPRQISITQEPAGSIGVGGTTTTITESVTTSTILVEENGKVTVTMGDFEQVFDLLEGENFYYLIVQNKKGGGRDVAKRK